MTFDEVIGQERTAQRLLQLLQARRMPHALMLCGPEGCGKLALGLALASHLLDNSRLLHNWEHPDLHFSYPVVRPADASSTTMITSDDYVREWRTRILQSPYLSMEQWLTCMKAGNQQAVIYEAESDALTRKLSMKSSQGGYKVVLMWLPERMNEACANKLLKLLEEPPQQTVFILVCEEPDRLLETIRSRVQRVDVPRVKEEAIAAALVTQRGLEETAARRVAHFAEGSWLKAVEVLEADSERRLLFDMFRQLMRLAYARNLKDLKKWEETVSTFGRERQRRMLTYFSSMVRENFMSNFGERELCYMSDEEEAFASKFSRFVNEANVIEMMELLQQAYVEIGQNVSAKTVFYDLALQMIVLLRKQ